MHITQTIPVLAVAVGLCRAVSIDILDSHTRVLAVYGRLPWTASAVGCVSRVLDNGSVARRGWSATAPASEGVKYYGDRHRFESDRGPDRASLPALHGR